MRTPEFTADCGHVIPAIEDGYAGSAGYGIVKIAGVEYKRCYMCCAAQYVQDMADSGVGILYLVEDRVDSDGRVHHKLTDWASVLSISPIYEKHSRGRGFGRPFHIITGRFILQSLIGNTPQLWSFRNQGDNQVARCKRLKD